jgi:hypothetical protein
MAKGTYSGCVPPDDPMFTGRYQLFTVRSAPDQEVDPEPKDASVPNEASDEALPTRRTPLQSMKEALDRSIQESGSDSLSSRMLKAEIARFERALETGQQTQAEQWSGRPLK